MQLCPVLPPTFTTGHSQQEGISLLADGSLGSAPLLWFRGTRGERPGGTPIKQLLSLHVLKLYVSCRGAVVRYRAH